MDDTGRCGIKIREKRQERGLSLHQLAELVNKTPSFLSQIERGLADPSITTLREIAKALGVPIFYFLLHEEKHNPVVRRNERKIIKSPEYKTSFQLLTPDLDRQMEVVWFELAPGASTVDDPLPHPGEECNVVIQGKMEIWVGDERYVLEAGDSIYYYAAIPHKITCISDDELIFLSAITPAMF